MNKYFITIPLFIIFTMIAMNSYLNAQIESQKKVNRRFPYEDFNVLNARIISILTKRDSLLIQVKDSNVFPISTQLKLQIRNLNLLHDVPNYPIEEIKQSKNIKRRRDVGAIITLTCGVVWAAFAYADANPGDNVSNEIKQDTKLYKDLSLYLTAIAGGYTLYNHTDYMISNMRMSSNIQNRENVILKNDSLAKSNIEILNNNILLVDEARELSIDSLNVELAKLVRNYYELLLLKDDTVPFYKFHIDALGTIQKDLDRVITSTTDEVFVNDDEYYTIDSIMGVIQNSAIGIDTMLVWVNLPIKGWISHHFFKSIQNNNEINLRFAKNEEVKLYKDTSLSDYYILNFGDTLINNYTYDNLIKVGASTYSVDSQNVCNFDGFALRSDLSNNQTNMLRGSIVWVKSDIVNIRKGPGTNYSIIRSIGRGNSAKLLKLENSWAFIEYLYERPKYEYSYFKDTIIENGWVYYPLVCLNKIEPYTNEQKRQMTRNKELTQIFNNHPEWSNYVKDAIRNEQIFIGMTKDQLIASWGHPDNINTSVGLWGKHEQWIYEKKYIGAYLYIKERYVYLEDGIVQSWQN